MCVLGCTCLLGTIRIICIHVLIYYQPSSFGAPGQPVPAGENRQDDSEAAPPSSTQSGAAAVGGGGGQGGTFQLVDSAHGGSGSYSQSNYDYQYSQQQQQQTQQQLSESTPPHSSPPNVVPSSTSTPPSQHTPTQQQQGTSATNSSDYDSSMQSKRLHVSNVPFRFREPDLRQLFYVSVWCVCVAQGFWQCV